MGCGSSLNQVFNINVFLVGVNGVKPDFKVVSACLDTPEETRSEAQRVSRGAEFVCECSLTGSSLALRYWDSVGVGGGGAAQV